VRATRSSLRVAGTIVLTGLSIAYIVCKIEVRQTVHILANADLGYFALAALIAIAAIFPLSWRWQRLLAARGVDERLGWLTRTYFTSTTIAQILPSGLGGDATRIFSTTRRHRDAASVAAGSVLLERALGGFATLALAAAGFVLAFGRYEVGAYLWIEAVLFAGGAVAAFVLLSARARRPLAHGARLLRLMRIDRPIRAAYEGVHGYRRHPGLLSWAFALTLAVQAFRVLAIWLVARAVGVHLSPRPFFVLGPLLFLVALVPFTVNGLAIREAFFVSFLGKLHVGPDPAFATGFLFYLLSITAAIPGALLLLVGEMHRAGKDKSVEIRT
jgi:uncharacterized protein (TIRG00374 family)